MNLKKLVFEFLKLLVEKSIKLKILKEYLSPNLINKLGLIILAYKNLVLKNGVYLITLVIV